MRTHSLILLFLLLVAAQASLGKSSHGAGDSQHSVPRGDPSVPLDKTQHKRRGRPAKRMTSGKFVSKDEATCRWGVSTQQSGITLKVECVQKDHEFSCVFAGDPAGCLQHHQAQVYWKQIARALRKQKNICRNSKSVLKSRACKQKFPESNLKLATPDLLVKPRKEGAALSSSSAPSSDPKLVSSTPAVTQKATAKTPECLEDPDVANQRKTALEFCGESWSSLCTFFLNMLQATSC